MSSERKIKLKPDERDKIQQDHGFYMSNIKPSFMEPIPAGVICEHCRQHKASIKWSEGIMGANHDAYWYWCKCCALKEQVRFAEERAAKLQELKDELKRLKCE